MGLEPTLCWSETPELNLVLLTENRNWKRSLWSFEQEVEQDTPVFSLISASLAWNNLLRRGDQRKQNNYGILLKGTSGESGALNLFIKSYMVLEATNGGHDQGDVSQCTLPFMMYEAIHKQQQCAFYGKCAPSNIIIMDTWIS